MAWVRGAQGTGRQAGWPLLRKRSGKYLAQVSRVREALCWTTAPILIPTQTRGLTEAHHLQSPSANAGSLAPITKLGQEALWIQILELLHPCHVRTRGWD